MRNITLTAPSTGPLAVTCLALTLCACATAGADPAATPVATGSTARHGASLGLPVQAIGANTFKVAVTGDAAGMSGLRSRAAAAANEHCAGKGKSMRELAFSTDVRPGVASYVPVVGLFAGVPTAAEITFTCTG